MGIYSVLLFVSALVFVLLLCSVDPGCIHTWAFGIQMLWQTFWHLLIQYGEYYLHEPVSIRYVYSDSTTTKRKGQKQQWTDSTSFVYSHVPQESIVVHNNNTFYKDNQYVCFADVELRLWMKHARKINFLELLLFMIISRVLELSLRSWKGFWWFFVDS